MKLFISWSGKESREIAQYVTEWVNMCFINNIETFISTEDIKVGEDWFSKLSTQLDEADACLICFTPDNLNSKWIHFEIGAAANSKNGMRVMSIVPGNCMSKIGQPLSKYQLTNYSREGFYDLFNSLNELIERPIEGRLADKNFSLQWTGLETKLQPYLDNFEKDLYSIDQNIKILTKAEEVSDYNMRIVQNANEILLTTGSRSRDKNYLNAIEEKLSTNTSITYYRVLINEPHHDIFKKHLSKLFDYRDPKQRENGGQKLYLSLFKDTYSESEKFVCANEKEALIVLPSFTLVSRYDTALVIEHQDGVDGVISYVKNLHIKSKEIKTREEVDAIELYEVK